MLLLWRLVSFSTDGGKHQLGAPRHIISDTQLECIYIKFLILLNTFQTIKHNLVILTVLWSYGDCLTGGANPQVHLYAYIPDISGDIIDSKEYQIILNAVNTTPDTFKQMLKDVKDMTHKSNSPLKDALDDIKKFRQEINQRLDELKA
jgi:hypothetical protein